MSDLVISRTANKTDIDGTRFPLGPVDQFDPYPLSILLAKPTKLSRVDISGFGFELTDNDQFIIEVQFLNPMAGEEESSIFRGVRIQSILLTSIVESNKKL